MLPAKFLIHWIFYYSKLAQITLVGPGIHPQNGQRDNFTRGPPCLQHSMFGDSVRMKPPLTPVFFQRLASTHIPAYWCKNGGFCRGKWLEKTLKTMIFPDSCSCTRSNKQQPSLASRDNLAWSHSCLKPQIFFFYLHLWRN